MRNLSTLVALLNEKKKSWEKGRGVACHGQTRVVWVGSMLRFFLEGGTRCLFLKDLKSTGKYPSKKETFPHHQRGRVPPGSHASTN